MVVNYDITFDDDPTDPKKRFGRWYYDDPAFDEIKHAPASVKLEATAAAARYETTVDVPVTSGPPERSLDFLQVLKEIEQMSLKSSPKPSKAAKTEQRSPKNCAAELPNVSQKLPEADVAHRKKLSEIRSKASRESEQTGMNNVEGDISSTNAVDAPELSDTPRDETESSGISHLKVFCSVVGLSALAAVIWYLQKPAAASSPWWPWNF